MNNNSFYFNRYITQRLEKILRLTELVCCTACFVLSIIVFLKRLYFVTKVVLMVVSTTFLFITLVDAISWVRSRPMGHRTWVIFSVAAFHMFCLCGGFLLFLKRITNQRLLQATCAVNIVTAHAYILDCFLLIFRYIRWIHRNDTRVVPTKRRVDRAVSTCFMQEEWGYISGRSTPRLRSSLRTRPLVIPTYSYGGTFSVSKDLPPLPTPDPLREFQPRRRMYCTMVNPYPLLDGAGDFRRTYPKVDPEETKIDLLAKDTTFFRKLPIYSEYRVEIQTPRIFSKIWSQFLLTKFQYLRMRSQSYGGEVSVFPGTELSRKKAEDTDVAEDSVVGDRKQTSREMIVAYCKPGSGNPPITVQDCVFHQYYQQPCFRCGKTHYQQQTTINGTLCCPPVVCTSSKPPPVQIIQIPCGNQSCPGAQQTMQSPCGNPNCPTIQEKAAYGGTSNSSIKRNGLQQEYGSRRRFSCPEPQVCSPCGRRYKPPVYAEEPDDMYCMKECPRPLKCVDQCPAQAYKCICGNGISTAVAETTTEQEQLKNTEVMAVQEMRDEKVQMTRTTMEDNPQTSETRLVNASFLSKLLDGKCVASCPGGVPRYSPEETTNAEDESSERDTTTEAEERESSHRQRDSRTTRPPKASKAPRASKASKRSQRLTAGGPIEDWQQDGTSRNPSGENITKSVPVIKTETADSIPPQEGVRPNRSATKGGSRNTLQVPSKMSYRDATTSRAVEEPVTKKSSKRYQLEASPSKTSVCECLIQGYPSRDCKKAKMRETPSARGPGAYDKPVVSYRDLPEQDASDEAIGETTYEDEQEKSREALDQPVEEPQFQKTRAPSRLVGKEPSAQVVAFEQKSPSAHEPSQKSKLSQSSSESQKSPVRSQKSKASQGSQPLGERREETSSEPSSQDEQQQVEGEQIDSGKKGNEEWCLKCCTKDTVKQKKKWCNFFSKKKKK